VLLVCNYWFIVLMTIQVQGSVGGILLVRFKLVGEERSSLRGCG
jgi:hypothetical protein